jgi:hypothetical protein
MEQAWKDIDNKINPDFEYIPPKKKISLSLSFHMLATRGAS